MKYTFCFMLLCMVFLGHAQPSHKDISGSYYLSSNDPQGGTNFIIMPNHKFVVAYFGGMRKGTWEQDDTYYTFNFTKEPSFVLYGRINPSLADSIQVRVGLDGNRQFAVRFNGTEKEAFTPIFNEDSNCYSYPYIYPSQEMLSQVDVYAPDLREYYEGEIYEVPDYYRFEINQEFNEYILTGLPNEYSEEGSFTAIFKNGKLNIDGSQTIKKGREYKDLNPEDLKFFKRHTENEIFPNVLEYRNEFFPYYEEPSDDDLIPFTRIEAVLLSSKGVVVNGAPLFEVRCED